MDKQKSYTSKKKTMAFIASIAIIGIIGFVGMVDTS